MEEEKSSATEKQKITSPRIIGTSHVIRHLAQDVKSLARDQRQILLYGPTGTGKELFADYYQACSPRSSEPYAKRNCTGWPETLIEDELFGHERGAFTDAISSRAGIIEDTDQGILFLDEIGDLPGHTQGKLLRVMEDGMVRRLGSNTEKKVKVLFIAATNKMGAIREDLKYRFTTRLEVPPLVSRREDVPFLIKHFLEKSPYIKNIEERCLLRLLRYSWPGNVRELKGVIDSAISFANIHLTLEDDHLRDMIPDVRTWAEEENFPRESNEVDEIERKSSSTVPIELDKEFIKKCNELLVPISTIMVGAKREYSDTTESQLKRMGDLAEAYLRHCDLLESLVELPKDQAIERFLKYYTRFLLERFKGNIGQVARHMQKSASVVSRMKKNLR